MRPAVQHLAQLNLGRIRHPVDDPRMADFVNNVDRITAFPIARN
jgi:hypothetical protein